MGYKFELLHQYPLFDGLNEEQMQAVIGVCREECFLPGSTLFAEGEPAAEIFVLVAGDVEESFTVDGAELSLRRHAAAGEVIGCPALVQPFTQRCTVRSINEIEVLAIDAAGLRQLFAQDCELARTMQYHFIEALLDRLGSLRLAGVKAL